MSAHLPTPPASDPREPPAGTAPSGLSAEALWGALRDQSGAWLILVRADGVVLDMNDAVLGAKGLSRESCVGKPLGEVLPGGVGQERADYAAMCARTGRRVSVDGLLGGLPRRCVYIPFASGGPGAPLDRVLIVSRAQTPGGPPAEFRAEHDDKGPLGVLTDRELAVLRLIARGYSTTRIAQELGRSVKTVEWHRVSLGSKLGVKNRVELTRLAIRFGLADVDGVDEGAGAAGGSEPRA